MLTSLVRIIGYQLATVLVEKLAVAIKQVFLDKKTESNATVEMITSRKQQRKALMKSISEAKDNEQRKQLSILLSSLDALNS